MTVVTTVIAVVAIVISGLLVGVEGAVALIINPLLDALPGDAGLLGRASGARVLGRVMPFWYLATVLVVAIDAALAWTSGGGGPLVIAALLFAGSVVLSLVVLVPINSRVASWSTGTAPAEWRDQVARWDRWHILRVGMILTGFVLVAVAGAR